MKKIFFLAVMAFSLNAPTTTAQTNVPAGSVSGTWTLAGSPYLIQGSIQIPDDSTLTIQPGVTVNFQGAFKLDVQGRLLAMGTLTDSITFIPADSSVGWRGIRFDNTSSTNDTSRIVYCKLQYGKASGNFPSNCGGAFYFYNFSKAVISNNNISKCSADYYGGGIYLLFGNPIITNNIISNNVTFKGGGLYIYASSPTMSNNNISNNMASGGGGGIYCYVNGNPSIINNTIVNNSSTNNGGAIYCESANPVLRNTILWGNTASISGAQVYLYDQASQPNFYYCDVQGGSAAFDVNGNIYTGAYQNNVDTDPLFAAPSGGSGTGYNGVMADWSLQSTSPCIDKGDPNGTYPTTDIAGNPRVNVCRIDMGAYEYQTGIPLAISLSISQPILCNGAATGAITAVASGGTSPYAYLWSNGQTTTNSTGLVAGDYSVSVSTASYGCSIIRSITLTEPPAISVNAGIDKTIVCGGTVQLDSTISNYTGAGTLTYKWAPAIGLNYDTVPNPTATVTGDTKYFLTITTPNGCIAIDSITVIVNSLIANAGLNKTIICGGTVQLDSTTSNYTGTGTLTYSWSPATGLSNDAIPNPYATITSNTTYVVTVLTSNGCMSTDSVRVFVNPLVANAGLDKTIICGGTVQLDSATSNYTGTGILSYHWSPLTGLNNDTIPNPYATATNDTTYFITIITPNGCAAIDSVKIFVNPLMITGTGGTLACGDSTMLNTTTNYTGTGALTYSWLPATGLDSLTIANPWTSVNSNQTYTVSVTTPNGCGATDTANIKLIPMNAIGVCIVGVDSTNKNLIVWNKQTSVAIDSFYIYRETNITNSYQKIGAVGYNSLSVFSDTGSFPEVQSNKYKISIKDKCGLESDTSAPHKTMHLAINQGIGTTWNLIWDPYQGFTVSTYNIYRGIVPNNLQLIGTSSGSNMQYSDLTPPTGDVYYQVEVVSSNSCNPSKNLPIPQSYNSSRSNIATNNNNGIFENSSLSIKNFVYPNPAHDLLNIRLENALSGNLIFSLYDITGKIISNDILNNSGTIFTIPVKHLEAGMYFYEIRNNIGVARNKFIKE